MLRSIHLRGIPPSEDAHVAGTRARDRHLDLLVLTLVAGCGVGAVSAGSSLHGLKDFEPLLPFETIEQDAPETAIEVLFEAFDDFLEELPVGGVDAFGLFAELVFGEDVSDGGARMGKGDQLQVLGDVFPVVDEEGFEGFGGGEVDGGTDVEGVFLLDALAFRSATPGEYVVANGGTYCLDLFTTTFRSSAGRIATAGFGVTVGIWCATCRATSFVSCGARGAGFSFLLGAGWVVFFFQSIAFRDGVFVDWFDAAFVDDIVPAGENVLAGCIC